MFCPSYICSFHLLQKDVKKSINFRMVARMFSFWCSGKASLTCFQQTKSNIRLFHKYWVDWKMNSMDVGSSLRQSLRCKLSSIDAILTKIAKSRIFQVFRESIIVEKRLYWSRSNPAYATIKCSAHLFPKMSYFSCSPVFQTFTYNFFEDFVDYLIN